MEMSFPKNLSIQTTSFCNGHCVFCPNDDIKSMVPNAIMERGLYKKIIDECGFYPAIEKVILYLNNEPLTDPNLIERINYAKEKVPSASVHLLTNASLLTQDLSEKLIDSKLDWIGFSLHGIRKETIEKSMGIKYEPTFKRVSDFIEKAKYKRNIKDFIMVTFLRHQYLSQEEADEAVRFWQAKGIERISFFEGPVSRAGNVKALPQTRHKKIQGCTSIWANEMIHIVESGDVILCCMDWKREVVLGNVGNHDICEIWNSKRYQDIRDKRDGKKESEEDFICKKCEAAIPGGCAESLGVSEPCDIILVMPPPWGVDAPPLGLACLYTYLKDKGLKPKVFDFNIHLYNHAPERHHSLWEMSNANYWTNDESFDFLKSLFSERIDFCVKQVIDSGAKVAGFSVLNTPQGKITAEIIKRVKTIDPSIKIILGGTSVSVNEQRLFFEHNINHLIEAYVIAEGEEALYEILQATRSLRGLEGIQGVMVFKNGKQIYKPRILKENLDDLLFPVFEGFDLGSYVNKAKSLIMEWSRGCVGSCAFCAFKSVSSKFRARSPESVVKAIEYYKEKYQTEHFGLVDSAVNGDMQNLEKICDLLIKSNCNAKFSGLAMPRKGMNEGLLEKMKKAGFLRLEYGVESGSDKVLKAMRKIFSPEDSEKALEETHKAGIQSVIYLMVGFPGEGEDEFAKTCDFVKRNARYIDHVRSINPLYLMAGSPIYKDLKDYGITQPQKDADFRWNIGTENTYEIRVRRVKMMRALLDSLGIKYDADDVVFEKELKAARIEPKAKECDVLLVTLPPWGVENPPIGLGYLDAYIRDKGLKPKILDLNIYFHNTAESSYKMLWHVENKNYWSNEKVFPLLLEVFKDQINYAQDKILSCDTDLIGFSVVDPKEKITAEVIKRIKNIAPRKKIILGGPACSTEEQRDFFIRNIPGMVDFFVVGEGEEILFEIIEKEKGGLSGDSGIDGLAIKENGRWNYRPRAPIVPIDRIPFPDYSGFDLSQYNGGKAFLVEWSRGCIGRCTFCKNYRLTSGYRMKSAEHILRELEFLVSRYGIKEFTVCDNLMNGDIQQLESVCNAIIANKFKLKWSGQIAPRKQMSRDLFSKMYQAGCYKVQIGVESGSDKVLRKMRKSYTSNIAEKNIMEAKKAGMETEIFILVGFPGEAEEEFKKTCNFIKRNYRHINAIKSINTLHLIAGTDIYERPKEYGLKELPKDNWHYLWETEDGSNYSVRRRRAARVLELACDLGLRVMETNAKEGKERNMGDLGQEGLDAQLEKIKAGINRIQPLPQRTVKRMAVKIRRGPYKFMLLGAISIYTLFYIAYFWFFKKVKGRSLLGGD